MSCDISYESPQKLKRRRSGGMPGRKPSRPTGQTGGSLEAGCFNLALTMECGQVFGWHKHDNAYFGIIKENAVVVAQMGDQVKFCAAGALAASDIAHYLGLDDDLRRILASVAVDPFMKRVLTTGKGLRLLRQEPWHCLCSYLLSSSNRVERIDRLVKEIARTWGTRHTISGRRVYRLPEPARLAGCGEAGIRACGAGFRSPYLVRAAKRVADGTIDFALLQAMPYEEAKEVLMTIDGVGDKIADCVLLFAFSKYEAFPVDVWIKKAVEKVYFNSKVVNNNEIRRFAREHFGAYAGYAQEYIYYHVRTHGME